MKKLLFALAVLLAIPFTGNSQSINWMTIQEALELNEKNPKMIIVDVYTDWCGWCKRMDKDTFSNPAIIDYINKNFYAVKFDAESKTNIVYKGKTYNPGTKADYFIHEFTYRLLGDDFGYPAYAFLDEKNNVVHKVVGYFPPEDFMENLKFVIQNK